MKKLIKFFFTCAICVGITYYLYLNPEITVLISDRITDTVEIIGTYFEKDLEEYTSDFQINELEIEKDDYYYGFLTSNQKTVYNYIAHAVKDLKKEFKVKGYELSTTPEAMSDVSEAMDAFFNDHPEVFYLETSYRVAINSWITGQVLEIQLAYTVTNEIELQNQIRIINAKINDMIKNVPVNNIFETELELHDRLCKSASYFKYTDIDDIPMECHTIYGTFVKDTAVCDGFSKAMQILLDRVGIESIITVGNLQGESHAWNMVHLDDEWYHLDVTSDKSLYRNDELSNYVIHSYFNVTTENIKATHSIKYERKIPRAVETKYNYYVYMNKYISNNDYFTSKIKSILDNNKDTQLVEFSADNINKVADKMTTVLADKKYNEYVSSNNVFKYYIVLNSYIMVK